jgi:hypothetical protein
MSVVRRWRMPADVHNVLSRVLRWRLACLSNLEAHSPPTQIGGCSSRRCYGASCLQVRFRMLIMSKSSVAGDVCVHYHRVVAIVLCARKPGCCVGGRMGVGRHPAQHGADWARLRCSRPVRARNRRWCPHTPACAVGGHRAPITCICTSSTCCPAYKQCCSACSMVAGHCMRGRICSFIPVPVT